VGGLFRRNVNILSHFAESSQFYENNFSAKYGARF
jgi:hypothetical protein